MRLAWFRPSRRSADDSGAACAAERRTDPSDDTALLVEALSARHTIALIDALRAHDFVWQHARQPFDACVFELGGTPAHQFVPAYAAHYPGIVMLRGVPRHDHALQAARLVVVPHEPVSQALADDYPGIRVRTLTPGVEPLPDDADDVIVALRWPPDGAALTYAISGFAARRAVVVFDGPETADWPSLDPQNWSPRHRRSGHEPICVSIDPRDETHSLRLALRALERDAALREQLGTAAHRWWREHATVERAAAGFERLLDEARTASAPRDAESDDGTITARQILDVCGVAWPWSGESEEPSSKPEAQP